MATKYLSNSPKFRAVTANGTPLASGKLYVYAAGTTTPADSYSDSAGSANANPVVLDSEGECNLYLTPGLKYDLKLLDSTNYLIWTGNRVSAPVTPSTYFAALMTSASQSALFTTIVAPGGTVTGDFVMEAAYNYAEPVTLLSGTSTPIGAAASNSVSIYPIDGVYFNPSYKGTAITLSSNNSVATANNTAFATTLGATGKSSGKWYFEVRLDTNPVEGNIFVGVGNTSLDLDDFLGKDANGWAAAYNTGTGNPFRGYHNNVSPVLDVNSLGSGTIIGIALDLSTGEIRSYANNTGIKALGLPVFSSVTGTVYPALTLYNVNDVATLRVLDSEFTYSPPSGYTAWGV